MSNDNITQLNQAFALQQGSQQLQFSLGPGDIPVIDIVNSQASAKISLQGAHLLSWIPEGEADVIWLSSDASFAVGKSVRGGIPICWPWFGAHESDSSFPAHGFARTVLWQVSDTQALASGETQITFQLDSRELADKYRAMWPQASLVEYRLTIGKQLSMELITTNHSDQDIRIGQALHTYFHIADIADTRVHGLEGKDYLDKTDGFKRKAQKGAIVINSEVDRVYVETADEVVIDDQRRQIHIQKYGSESTVVWNPWQAVAEKMGDLGKEGYRKMLCVESANAVEDTVTIAAGDSFSLRVLYQIAPV